MFQSIVLTTIAQTIQSFTFEISINSFVCCYDNQIKRYSSVKVAIIPVRNVIISMTCSVRLKFTYQLMVMCQIFSVILPIIYQRKYFFSEIVFFLFYSYYKFVSNKKGKRPQCINVFKPLVLIVV
jgi:hypothetical protein